MSKRLPPVSALRGFEAAGRLGSFSKAAEELAMSQSAVSHQIKSLEDFLGQPLFKRINRSAVLTDAGYDLLGTVEACLRQLEDGVRRLEQYKKPGQVIVSVSHAFASRWLLPRLPQFRAQHPDLDVWLYTTDQPMDFERQEVDLSIWLGDGKWPGLEVTKLFEEDLMPLCAPPLLNGRRLEQPGELLDFTLLHDERREDWRSWFAKAGVAATPPVAGPNFSDSGLLLQAAADGQGMALGSLLLAADDLREGRLVVAYDLPLKSKLSYYTVCADRNLARPMIRSFHDWLIVAARDSRATDGISETGARKKP